MAKLGKALQTKARGRIGNIVYSVVKGQQVARELAVQVANPRTDQQMDQRTRLANIVNLYRVNKPWMVKFGFETKPQTQSDYNAFVAANLVTGGPASVYLTKQEAALGAAVASPLTITKGSLRGIQHVQVGDTKVVRTNIFLGSSSVNLGSATVAEVSALILANNNGFRYGDFLSLILNIQQSDTTSGIPYVVERQYQVTLSGTDTTPFADALGNSGVSAVLADGNYCLAYEGTDTAFAVAFIHSRYEGGETKVSSQTFCLINSTYYDLYSTLNQREKAFRSYGETSQNFLSGQGRNSENISLTQSILSVGGVAAGAYFGQLDAHADTTTEPGKMLTTILMAASVPTKPSVSVLSATGGSAISVPAADVSFDGSRVIIDTTNLGSANGNVLQTLSVTIDGDSFSITFATSAGNDDNAEGQTE